MLAIDPYSSQSEIIFHYLLNRNDLAELALKMHALNYTDMEFTLSPIAVAPESYETSGILHGKRTDIFVNWSPAQLASGKNSTVNLVFVAKETGYKINGEVHYSLDVLFGGIPEPIRSKVGLVAKNGTDSQTFIFPTNGTYRVQAFITSVDKPDLPPDSAGDYADGIVVIPEFGSSVAFAMAAISSVVVIVTSKLYLLKKK